MMRNRILSEGFLAACALLAAGGCESGVSAPPAAITHDEHDNHPTEGPHGGDLIELGEEEYHAELIHDESSKTVAIYVLDSAAKAAVPIEATEVTLNLVAGGQPVQFTLPAAPDSGDPAGKSSRFSLTDEMLCTTCCAEGTTGRLALIIAGKPYSGAIEHHEHAGHEHGKQRTPLSRWERHCLVNLAGGKARAIPPAPD